VVCSFSFVEDGGGEAATGAWFCVVSMEREKQQGVCSIAWYWWRRRGSKRCAVLRGIDGGEAARDVQYCVALMEEEKQQEVRGINGEGEAPRAVILLGIDGNGDAARGA
jgi:hypothetical protein